ncbi:MAG: sensor histidine kinase KdpD [Sandaracinaceae bacterium]|nr:sensor histidine kinase KdpD [Sandaracinaceae bacterium]
MAAGESRPDPDALLARVNAEETRKSRARLKIFFGFAPGVGKTFAMLELAQRLHKDGVDVVVGVVETHGRADTAALMEGLEILKRRVVEYRGARLEEFDVDAAIARKPKVVLVDELAHTNAPHGRHAKRWQDVLDLLDAGIDVYTTLNVQHVESLNDVVAQITHVEVRETVPDSVLARADDLELVDLTPDELLVRMREGKVYGEEQAARAQNHFFKHGNLIALRELALRRTAERVDADMQDYRRDHGIESTWAASERILVCVGPSPASARLARAAFRMVSGLRAPWIAVSVDTPRLRGMSDADRARLEAHLRLAETLGGEVIRLTGDEVSATLLAYARTRNVTRIIIGKPTHSWWRDRFRGSLLDELVRGSGDIDVHVIRGAGEAASSGDSPPAQPFRAGPYLSAALMVAVATGLGTVLTQILSLPDVVMIFLLGIMLVALRFGRGPSVLAATLSVACLDFFFVPPFYTFAVSDVRHSLTFGVMFVVGLVMSSLTTRLRHQEEGARLRERRTASLYALTREIGRTVDPFETAAVAARLVHDALDAHVTVLAPTASGTLQVLAASPGAAELAADELGVARWAFEHGQLAGAHTATLSGARVQCTPLTSATGKAVGVLALRIDSARRSFESDDRHLLDSFARQIAVAIERARYAEEAKDAQLKMRTEEMRSSLLSAVSHDLRTPLAAITGAASTLLDTKSDLASGERLEMLQTICEEAERLERLVANLLEMVRLDSGTVAVKSEWVPLEEIVGSALARLEKKLQNHTVRIDLPADLPLIAVDPVLFEHVFLNLFENAAKYTPPGSAIEVTARQSSTALEIDVADRGPGLPPGDEARVFEKFFRGQHVGVGGVGLGLAICRSIVEAHKGSMSAHAREGGGTVFRINLPRGENPPTVPPEEGES